MRRSLSILKPHRHRQRGPGTTPRFVLSRVGFSAVSCRKHERRDVSHRKDPDPDLYDDLIHFNKASFLHERVSVLLCGHSQRMESQSYCEDLECVADAITGHPLCTCSDVAYLLERTCTAPRGADCSERQTESRDPWCSFPPAASFRSAPPPPFSQLTAPTLPWAGGLLQLLFQRRSSSSYCVATEH